MGAEGSRAQPARWVSQSWAALHAGACAGDGPPWALGADPSGAVTTQPPNPSSPPAWPGLTLGSRPRCTQAQGSFNPCPAYITALLPCGATVPNRHPSRPELSQGAQGRSPSPGAFHLAPSGTRAQGGAAVDSGLGWGDRGLQMSSAQLLFQGGSGDPLQGQLRLRAPLSHSTHSPSLEVTCHPCLLSGLRSWAPGLRAGRLGMNRGPWDAAGRLG